MANYYSSSSNLSKSSVKTYSDLNLDFTRNVITNDISKIKGVEVTRSTKPNLVMYDEFQTIKPYTFVVGEKKSMVTLPEVKV